MITFNSVLRLGDQYEIYRDSYETRLGHHLSVSDDYLLTCDEATRGNCWKDTRTQAYVGSQQEVQSLFLCDDVSTALTLFDQTVLIPVSPSPNQVKSSVESVLGVGKVNVNIGATGGAAHGCGGAFTEFLVEFGSLRGDVPSTIVNQGKVVETIKGLSQFVEGVSTYSADINFGFIDSESALYVRVGAVNTIGTSEFAYPQLFPQPSLHEAVPPRPVNIATEVVASDVEEYAKVGLKVTWALPRNDVVVDTYDVQFDTIPSFSSSCRPTRYGCSSATYSPLEAFSVAHPVQEFLYTNAIAGQSYYVRVRACATDANDVSLCSDWSFLGFPADPVSTFLSRYPDYVADASLTLVDASSIALTWESPAVLPQGSNGLPIDSYTVRTFRAVDEVQKIVVNTTASGNFGEFAFSFDLVYFSRCIPLGLDAATIELMLEEMREIDSVSVSISSSTANSRVILVTFDGPYLSNGDVPQLKATSAECGAYPAVSIATSTVVEGQAAFVPEIIQIKTSKAISSPFGPIVRGNMNLRYGFRGHMTKWAYANGDSTRRVGALSEAGKRQITLQKQSSLSGPTDGDVDAMHLICAGVVLRIGDQEVMVESIDGTQVTVVPPLVRTALTGDESKSVFVSDTLVSVAFGFKDSNIIHMLNPDFNKEIVIGDRIYVEQRLPGQEPSFSSVFRVAAIPSASTIQIGVILLADFGNAAV